jgi:integrase
MALRMVGVSRDPKTGSWVSRKVIPADVRTAYGKANEKKSWPRSVSAAEVKIEQREWASEVEARIERLRKVVSADPVTLTRRELSMYAGEFYRRFIHEFGEDPRDPVGWEVARANVEPDGDPDATSDWKEIPTVTERVDAILIEEGLSLTPRSRHELLQEATERYREACVLLASRAVGDFRRDLLPEQFPEWSPASKPIARVAVSLMDLFDGYSVDGDPPPKPATVKAWRRHTNRLVEFLGHGDAARLAREDVERWRDHLASTLMPNGKRRTAKTVNESYLAGLRAVLSWAVENKKLPENVAKGVTVKTRKRAGSTQRGFTQDEARTILKAAMIPPTGSLSAPNVRARRWAPWLCAYTGARIAEITQLRKADVIRVDGVWAIKITPDAGSTKKGLTIVVPLHDDLIDQGFLDVVGRLKDGPMFYDPSRARGGSDENPQASVAGRRLSDWVRGLGVTDPDVAPNHAWRHRFKTICRTAKVDPEARAVLMGHATTTEGENYGYWEMPALKAEIDKLSRFDLADNRA